MGSAQSARRIQPGGVLRPCRRSGGSFPPPVPPGPSTRPSSPPRRRLPSPEGGRSGGRGGRAGGVGGGVGGGPPPGRRPAAAGRISTAAVRRDRLRDGWEGPAGKVARGRPALSLSPSLAGGGAEGTGSQTPPSVTAPRPQRSPNPGAEGARPVAALSPLPAPTPAGVPREGVRSRGGAPGRSPGGAGPPLPRRDRSTTPGRSPSSPPGVGSGGAGGGADCPQCAPGGSRRRARGVKAPREASARGRRRCRPPTRPVLKHGPRSLTRARVGGSHESRRGAMKVKAGGSPAGRGGIPRPLQSAEGAPPARLARRAGEVEHERTC